MILEMAILDVKAGKESEFELAFNQAQEIIAGMDGYVSHQLQKCVEKRSRYLLLVKWKSLKHHIEGFRGSSQYQEWRKILHHFYEPFPVVEHYAVVFDSDA